MPAFNLLDSIRQAQALRGGCDGAPASRRAPSRPFPPSLIGGESGNEGGEGRKARLDWLTVTWLPKVGVNSGAMIYKLLTGALGGVMGETVNGLFGYADAIRFSIAQEGKAVHVARVDWGGDHHGGRARLDISGAGCSRVADWQKMMVAIAHFQDVTITRVDLAVDLLNGEYSVEDAVEWYQQGDFNAGGRMPSHSLIGDWLSPQRGRTIMVGRRENGKCMRCYEKGRQLGDSSSPWTRFEVEIRNTDREIPLDILINPDTYFVGAYRCLERLLAVAGTRIATNKKEGEISVEYLLGHARIGYGKLAHVLRAHMSADDILSFITRPGIPKRLERASLGGFFQRAADWSSQPVGVKNAC